MTIIIVKLAATYIILSIMLVGVAYGSYLDRSTATLFLFFTGISSPKYLDNIIGMFYYKPAIYTFSHLALGFIAAWYPVVGAVMVIYQLLQLAFNVRFFLFEMEIKEGNTWQHTALKLSEVWLGYIAGIYIRSKV